MSILPKSSRVIILVKALPQPSKQYGETVCCAGVTREGHWKRLYPIRFRHLQDGQIFKRWNWVKFDYREPTRGKREESCHAYEDTISVDGVFPERERSPFLNRIIVGSADHAAAKGQSLALIRPRTPNSVSRQNPKMRLLKAKMPSSRLPNRICSIKNWPTWTRHHTNSDLILKMIADITRTKMEIGKHMQCFLMREIGRLNKKPFDG